MDQVPDSIGIGDTVDVHVRALNRSGDSIPGAPIELVSLNPDTLGIDPARIAVFGIVAGTGRFIARAGNIPSIVLLIRIQ